MRPPPVAETGSMRSSRGRKKSRHGLPCLLFSGTAIVALLSRSFQKPEQIFCLCSDYFFVIVHFIVNPFKGIKQISTIIDKLKSLIKLIAIRIVVIDIKPFW